MKKQVNSGKGERDRKSRGKAGMGGQGWGGGGVVGRGSSRQAASQAKVRAKDYIRIAGESNKVYRRKNRALLSGMRALEDASTYSEPVMTYLVSIHPSSLLN